MCGTDCKLPFCKNYFAKFKAYKLNTLIDILLITFNRIGMGKDIYITTSYCFALAKSQNT